MTTVLLIAVGLSIFFAVLKLADSIRDIAFEIRETRRAIERDATNAQNFQKECLQTFKGQSEQPLAAKISTARRLKTGAWPSSLGYARLAQPTNVGLDL